MILSCPRASTGHVHSTSECKGMQIKFSCGILTTRILSFYRKRKEQMSGYAANLIHQLQARPWPVVGSFPYVSVNFLLRNSASPIGCVCGLSNGHCPVAEQSSCGSPLSCTQLRGPLGDAGNQRNQGLSSPSLPRPPKSGPGPRDSPPASDLISSPPHWLSSFTCSHPSPT